MMVMAPKQISWPSNKSQATAEKCSSRAQYAHVLEENKLWEQVVDKDVI